MEISRAAGGSKVGKLVLSRRITRQVMAAVVKGGKWEVTEQAEFRRGEVFFFFNFLEREREKGAVLLLRALGVDINVNVDTVVYLKDCTVFSPLRLG